MSLLNIPIFEYRQNETTFISFILPLKVLVNISEVLVYQRHPDGYQREPNKAHYNKIKKYVLEHSHNYMLPTSIILGADFNDIKSNITDKNGVKSLSIDDSKRKFHVVDGQHRIAGLSEAAKTDIAVGEFPLNIIVVLTNPENRSKELQIFTDINSKSKRINTDLAVLAEHDYQIKESTIPANADKINEHIAIKTAYILKDRKGENVWQNAIKFELHTDVTIGIIGVKTFSESIKGVVDQYMIENKFADENGILTGQNLIIYCQTASEKVSEFLLQGWNEIIKSKWQSTFKEDFVKNDEGELVKILYDKNYYIQKGLGVKSLNPILGEIVKETGLTPAAMEKVKEVISASKVKNDDWRNGGPFSGFNSESGFSKIKQTIMNKIALPGASNPNQIGLF